MKFIIGEPREDQNFSLIYEDYGFDIEPLYGGGETSILINYLQLEIDHKGCIIYVWGYCPLDRHQETNLFPQKYQNYSLTVLLEKDQTLGVSYRLNENEIWEVYINKEKGWVCLGDPNMEGKQLIQFAPNCIASMTGQELSAIWLHPEYLPGFIKNE